MGNIKSRLVLECSDDNIFIEFCKFIHTFTKDVECLYFVNKNYIIYKNNEKLYKSQVIFRLQKILSLFFILVALNLNIIKKYVGEVVSDLKVMFGRVKKSYGKACRTMIQKELIYEE